MSNPKHIFITPEAKNDLQNILAYTETEWGPKQVEIYKQKLFDGLQILLDHPEIGRAADEVLPDYRIWRIEQHFALYKSEESRISVIRILHVNADIQASF